MVLNLDELDWWIAYLQGFCDCLAKLEPVGECECCHETYMQAMADGLQMAKGPRPVTIIDETKVDAVFH